jgi:signal transduction histidine kinase
MRVTARFIFSVVILAVVVAYDQIVVPGHLVSVLYAVPMFIAAFILPPFPTLLIVGLSLLCALLEIASGKGEIDVWTAQAICLTVAAFLSYSLAKRIQDVTQLNRRLQVAKAAAEDLAAQAERDATRLRQLERAREEILRSITHDLRNPLTAILGNAQLLGQGPERSPQILRRAQNIQMSAQRMREMIAELADSARIEAGELKPQLQNVDLAAAVAQIVEQYSPGEESERIRVQVDPAVGEVPADPSWLERILANLVSNALKYGAERSEIQVKVVRQDGVVCVSVADQGKGIAPEYLPHIFDRYYRVPNGHAQREGLGLGLYITKGMIEAMGGQIRVESTVGKGSTFFFTLPAPRSPRGVEPSPLSPPASVSRLHLAG